MNDETSKRFKHVRFGVRTDVGRKRHNNEDAHGEWPAQGVFCVADGMGGAQDGEVASRAVIESLSGLLPRWSVFDPPLAQEDRLVALARGVDAASAWIKNYADSQGKKGCGSTFVGIALDPSDPSKATALHAGDSRVYRIRGKKIVQVTRDHSVAEMTGVKDERELNPMFRSLILRAVGIKPKVETDRTPFDVAEGDWVVICSDGLSRMVPDKEIARIVVSSEGPSEAASSLVDRANELGGKDNVTVVAVRIGALPPSPRPVHARLAPEEMDALFVRLPAGEGESSTVDTAGTIMSGDTTSTGNGFHQVRALPEDDDPDEDDVVLPVEEDEAEATATGTTIAAPEAAVPSPAAPPEPHAAPSPAAPPELHADPPPVPSPVPPPVPEPAREVPREPAREVPRETAREPATPEPVPAAPAAKADADDRPPAATPARTTEEMPVSMRKKPVPPRKGRRRAMIAGACLLAVAALGIGWGLASLVAHHKAKAAIAGNTPLATETNVVAVADEPDAQALQLAADELRKAEEAFRQDAEKLCLRIREADEDGIETLRDEAEALCKRLADAIAVAEKTPGSRDGDSLSMAIDAANKSRENTTNTLVEASKKRKNKLEEQKRKADEQARLEKERAEAIAAAEAAELARKAEAERLEKERAEAIATAEKSLRETVAKEHEAAKAIMDEIAKADAAALVGIGTKKTDLEQRIADAITTAKKTDGVGDDNEAVKDARDAKDGLAKKIGDAISAHKAKLDEEAAELARKAEAERLEKERAEAIAAAEKTLNEVVAKEHEAAKTLMGEIANADAAALVGIGTKKTELEQRIDAAIADARKTDGVVDDNAAVKEAIAAKGELAGQLEKSIATRTAELDATRLADKIEEILATADLEGIAGDISNATTEKNSKNYPERLEALVIAERKIDDIKRQIEAVQKERDGGVVQDGLGSSPLAKKFDALKKRLEEQLPVLEQNVLASSVVFGSQNKAQVDEVIKWYSKVGKNDVRHGDMIAKLMLRFSQKKGEGHEMTELLDRAILNYGRYKAGEGDIFLYHAIASVAAQFIYGREGLTFNGRPKLLDALGIAGNDQVEMNGRYYKFNGLIEFFDNKIEVKEIKAY